MLENTIIENATTLDPQREYEGILTRITNLGVAYLVEKTHGEHFGFTLRKVQGFTGQPLKELGIHPGARVYFKPTEDGNVEYVRLLKLPGR